MSPQGQGEVRWGSRRSELKVKKCVVNQGETRRYLPFVSLIPHIDLGTEIGSNIEQNLCPNVI